MTLKRFAKYFILALGVPAMAGATQADNREGVTTTEIKLAQVAAMDGPAAALGNLRDLDFGGLTMAFGEDDNQGMDAVYLT